MWNLRKMKQQFINSISLIKNNVFSIISIILSGLFFFSALSKIYYFSDTKHAIESLTSLILDKNLSVVLVFVIITLEILLSLLLLFQKFWRFAGLFTMILILVFTCVVFWGKSRDLIYECHCFGNLFGAKIGLTLAIRNVIIIIFGFCLVLLKKDQLNNIEKTSQSYTLNKSNILLLVINIFFLGRLVGLIF